MKLRKEREGMCDMTDEEVQEAEEYSNMLAKRVQELTTELAAANARISELERCCVVGGDGEPIAVGDTVTPIDRSLLNGTGIQAPIDPAIPLAVKLIIGVGAVALAAAVLAMIFA